MEKIYIAIDCNMEHKASIYALVTSIVANKNPNSNYLIYLITNGTSEDMWQEMLSLQNETTEICIWNDSVKAIKETNKIIYLQWNLIVTGDLSELFLLDLENKAFAAAKNAPEKVLNIPNECKKYNDAVRLIDISKMDEKTESDYLELSLYFNFGFEEFVKNDSRISNKEIGKNDKKYESIQEWSLILRYDKEYSPERYFDGPMAELWLKYYKLSPLKNQELDRVSRTETLGTVLQEKNQVIPVLISAEDNNVAYVLALISSLKEHIVADRKLDIRIVYRQLSTSHKEMLLSFADENTGILLYQVAQISERNKMELYAAQIFANFDKVLCVKTQSLVLGDISNLYDALDSEKWVAKRIRQEADVATSSEPNGKAFYSEMLPQTLSSVTIINVNAWIQNEVSKKIRNILNLEEYKDYSVDEALDIVSRKHIMYLSDEHCIKSKEELVDEYITLVHDHIAQTPWQEKLEEEIRLYEENEDEELKEVLEQVSKLEVENAKLKKKNKEVEKQNKVLKKERDQFLYEIVETRKSVTYKIGRLITFLPRLLRGNK